MARSIRNSQALKAKSVKRKGFFTDVVNARAERIAQKLKQDLEKQKEEEKKKKAAENNGEEPEESMFYFISKFEFGYYLCGRFEIIKLFYSFNLSSGMSLYFHARKVVPNSNMDIRRSPLLSALSIQY